MSTTTNSEQSTSSKPDDTEDHQKGLLVNYPDMEVLAKVIRGLNNVSPNDLPSFSGNMGEDAEEFIARYDGFATVYDWDEKMKLKYVVMSLKNNAAYWYQSQTFDSYADFQEKFSKTFGKNKIDYDLANDSGKLLIGENGLSYVYHILNYLKVTSPDATEPDKVSRLFDGLPLHLKVVFVRDMPDSVQKFIDRLKDHQREIQYAHKALLSAVNPLASLSLNPLGVYSGQNLAQLASVNSTLLPAALSGIQQNTDLNLQKLYLEAKLNFPLSGTTLPQTANNGLIAMLSAMNPSNQGVTTF